MWQEFIYKAGAGTNWVIRDPSKGFFSRRYRRKLCIMTHHRTTSKRPPITATSPHNYDQSGRIPSVHFEVRHEYCTGMCASYKNVKMVMMQNQSPVTSPELCLNSRALGSILFRFNSVQCVSQGFLGSQPYQKHGSYTSAFLSLWTQVRQFSAGISPEQLILQ